MPENDDLSGGDRIPQGPNWMWLLFPILLVIGAVLMLFYSDVVRTGLLR